MAQSETSRGLYSGSLASAAIAAGANGPPPARKVTPTPAPMMPHGHTLQFLISIIKNSQQRGPGAADSIKEGES